ncbi:MAG: AAA family ATPase, partial [Bacteroidota bacterium]
MLEAEVQGFQGTVKDSANGYAPTRISGFTWEVGNGSDQPNYSAICEGTETSAYVNNELRSELSCLVVNADQNLSYQLSYSTKWTLLSKVMRSFHKRLIADDDRVDRLKELFESIKSTFHEVPEFERFAENMSTVAGEMLTNMTHGLELDFSAYDPSNYFRSLRVHPTEEGATRAFEELGTGQQQILALAFAHAYSSSFLGENLILILDEPEAHLHPLAQRWLSRIINKMAEDGLQIVITTHSPYFVNLNYFDGIYLVRKDEDGTHVINHSAQSLYDHCIETNATRAALDTVVPFYANNAIPRILNGFFAKGLILVEGLTEELALPEYFMQVGLDVEKEGIDIIGVQ